MVESYLFKLFVCFIDDNLQQSDRWSELLVRICGNAVDGNTGPFRHPNRRV